MDSLELVPFRMGTNRHYKIKAVIFRLSFSIQTTKIPNQFFVSMEEFSKGVK